jgi:hypothetical protein
VKSVPHSLSFQKEFEVFLVPTITAKDTSLISMLKLFCHFCVIWIQFYFYTGLRAVLPASVKRFGIAVINKQRF